MNNHSNIQEYINTLNKKELRVHLYYWISRYEYIIKTNALYLQKIEEKCKRIKIPDTGCKEDLKKILENLQSLQSI